MTKSEVVPLPCPFCGSDVMRIDEDLDGRFAVVCPIVGCGYSSEYKPSRKEAIEAHNTGNRVFMDTKKDL